MLAYSTTNTFKDGPILPNPKGTQPILVLASCEWHSRATSFKLPMVTARGEMGYASNVALTVNRS